MTYEIDLSTKECQHTPRGVRALDRSRTVRRGTAPKLDRQRKRDERQSHDSPQQFACGPVSTQTRRVLATFREAAEKARKEEMDAVVQAALGCRYRNASDERNARPERNYTIRSRSNTARQNTFPASRAFPAREPPTPPEPLTTSRSRPRWRSIAQPWNLVGRRVRDYLAGIAWAGLRFGSRTWPRVFCTDVEVILTFHGARASTGKT